MSDVGHNVLLHEMRWWHINAALRGYYRRHRPLWESVRWIGWIVCRIMGNDSVKTPTDMMKFPWDKDTSNCDLSEEDVKHLTDLIDEENNKKRNRG